MALYSFVCERCGSMVIKRFPMTDHPDHLVCSACGGNMRRIISSPAIHFRGNGWGKDYKKDE